jgi:hypothetical protein
LFKFKRTIICREGLTRISYEFVGHFASLGTRKYTNNATATYNLFESLITRAERKVTLFPRELQHAKATFLSKKNV